MALPVQSDTIEVDHLPGEEVAFTIGEPRWVMRALADLYSDITLAVIREYSTNAYDAELAWAKLNGTAPKPVQITLPSVLSPYFKVKDTGIGMSAETLKTKYTSFGTSASRESEDANGMLGFGCKAAAAYSNSFTVTSVHDGTKTVAVINRRPDWSITLKTVAVVKTDEPNGTEVEIPVHNVNEFVQKANDFYKFLIPGRFLVNGQPVKQAVGNKITDNLYYADSSKGTWNLSSYVVMGNVPYRINNPQALFYGTGMNAVAFVAYIDNGDVEFSNSREDLKYTDKTKATLHTVINDFKDKIVAQAQAEISGAADHFAAFTKWCEWSERLGRGMFKTLNYRGIELVQTFPISGKRYKVNATRNTTQRIGEWQVGWSRNTLFVTDFHVEVSSNAKRKALDWSIFKNRPRPEYIIYTPASHVSSIWVPRANVVSWEKIKAEVPRKKSSYSANFGRLAGSFDYYTADGIKYEQSVPDGEVFWIALARAKDYNIVDILKALDSKAAVVILPANRVNKFNRDYPHIKEFINAASGRVVKEGADLLSPQAKDYRSLSQYDRQWLTVLDADRIDDVNWKRAAALMAKGQGDISRYQKNKVLASLLVAAYNDYVAPVNDSVTKPYPLLNAVGSNRRVLHDDIYTYMNAKYKEKKEAN